MKININKYFIKYIPLIFVGIQLCNAYQRNPLFYNKWVPIVPYDSFIWNEGPQQIRICDNDYVLWKHNDKISLQQNSCPHRCAPLSEGYITPDGNLACSYHGWSFDNNGTLINIPQMSECPSNKNLNLPSYDTKIVNNIVWAFITKIEDVEEIEDENSKLQNHTFDIIANYNENLHHNPNKKHNTFMRELPYDYYILLENFFDPSHIPFAHHKLQSERSAGSPINSTITETKKSIRVDFSDFSYKDPKTKTYIQRNGSIEFRPPYYYKLLNEDSNSYIKALHIYCVPVSESNCRVLLQYEFDETSIIYQIYQLLPIWLRHYSTNIFFDSDTLLLAKQEENIRKQINGDKTKLNKDYQLNNQPFYKMPASSDVPIIRLRRFLKPYMNSQITHDKLEHESREQILDRFEQHVKTCKHCKQALTNTNSMKKYGTSFIFALYFIIDDPIIATFAIVHYLILDMFQHIFIFQDYRHFNLDE